MTHSDIKAAVIYDQVLSILVMLEMHHEAGCKAVDMLRQEARRGNVDDAHDILAFADLLDDLMGERNE